MLYSKQIFNSYSNPKLKNSTLDESGKIRIASFDYDEGKPIATQEIIELCNLPSSNIKIIRVSLWVTGFNATQNMDISLQDKHNKVLTNLHSGALATNVGNGMLDVPLNNVFESEVGFVLNVKFNVAVPSPKKLSGYVLYVVE